MSAHPDDIASVTAANRDRLMGVAAAISTITNSERHMIDLADLEAKARAATHGEWSVLTSSLDSTRSIMAGDPAFFLARCHKSPVSDATANATYIVAAQPSVVLELIERVRAAEAKAGEPVAATHRHKKRGTEYVLIGIGRMQAEDWRVRRTTGRGDQPRVDMREVAIYRSVEEGSLWVRPREEFEDGRFERIHALGGSNE